jgi:histidinol dehydrogenase
MIQIRKLDSTAIDFQETLDALLAFEAETDFAIEQAVTEIIAQVRARGDEAVVEYTNKFDRIPNGGAASLQAFDIGQAELDAALAALPDAQRAALQTAAERIRVFHERQKQELQGFTYTEPDGTILGQRITALDRVGIYVPGGKAAYPSSVLMNAIPAKVAGVGEIVMVVPTPDGIKNQMVLAAAAIAGVDRVIGIGGAQAVAALAYGTESIQPVDKIVGPGNAYGAAA